MQSKILNHVILNHPALRRKRRTAAASAGSVRVVERKTTVIQTAHEVDLHTK